MAVKILRGLSSFNMLVEEGGGGERYCYTALARSEVEAADMVRRAYRKAHPDVKVLEVKSTRMNTPSEIICDEEMLERALQE